MIRRSALLAAAAVLPALLLSGCTGAAMPAPSGSSTALSAAPSAATTLSKAQSVRACTDQGRTLYPAGFDVSWKSGADDRVLTTQGWHIRGAGRVTAKKGADPRAATVDCIIAGSAKAPVLTSFSLLWSTK